MPFPLKGVCVEVRVRGELRRRIVGLGVDRVERTDKPLGVAADECLPELALPREVVVEARLGDPKLGRDVGVAEGVEPADADELLGDVEDLLGRISLLLWGLQDARSSLFHVRRLDSLPTSR